MSFKVIVAGGRLLEDYELVKKSLDAMMTRVGTNITVVSGCATGTDMLGERWARENKHSIVRFPANWDKYGKAAGPIRNEEMAKFATAAVIFWDGKSTGTKSMIDLASKHKLLVKVILY